MENRNAYNLRGLKTVFWGMILVLVSSVVTGVSGGLGNKISSDVSNIISLVFAAISLLAFLMIIFGLSRVKKYSVHFALSRKYYLMSVLLWILAVAAGAGGLYLLSTNNAGSFAGLAVLAVAILLVALGAVVGLLKIRQLMKGCAEVARQNADKKFSRKCTATWVFYLLTILASGVSVICVLFFGCRALLTVADATAGSINSVSDMNGYFPYFQTFFTVMVVCCILFLIATLLVMGKVNGTFMRYHNVAIPAGVLDDGEIPTPPFPGNAELEEEVGPVPVPPTLQSPMQSQTAASQSAAPQTAAPQTAAPQTAAPAQAPEQNEVQGFFKEPDQKLGE